MEPVRTAADEMGPGTLPARPREPMQQNGTGAGMGAGMGTGMGAGTGTGGGTGAGTGAGQEQYVDASDAPPQEFMYEKETLVVEPGEPGPQIAS